MTSGAAWTLHGTVEVVNFSTFFDLDVEFLVDFFASLGVQIFSTSAGRSSGGVRARAMTSFAVPLTLPDKIF